MPIPLEDQLGDVLGKARRGLRLSESQLAQKSGVGLENVESFGKGELLDDADTTAKIARALDLYAPRSSNSAAASGIRARSRCRRPLRRTTSPSTMT